MQYAALATKITAARLEPPPRGAKPVSPAGGRKHRAIEPAGGGAGQGAEDDSGDAAELRRQLLEKEEEVEDLTTRVRV